MRQSFSKAAAACGESSSRALSTTLQWVVVNQVPWAAVAVTPAGAAVAFVAKETGKATRLGWQINPDGSKVRIDRKSKIQV